MLSALLLEENGNATNRLNSWISFPFISLGYDITLIEIEKYTHTLTLKFHEEWIKLILMDEIYS